VLPNKGVLKKINECVVSGCGGGRGGGSDEKKGAT